MYIVTGSAGFIGSNIAKHFGKNARLLLIDKPQHFRDRGYFGPEEASDWDRARAVEVDPRHVIVDRDYFPKLLTKLKPESEKSTESLIPTGEKIEAIIHIGAITDTNKDRDLEEMRQWNTEYTKSIWHWCAEHKVPLVYASTAATYGTGDFGFSDAHEGIEKLQPMNPYAVSKQEFDLWALAEVAAGKAAPPNWYGLKFFNVYGPNEEHKGRMASTIYHSFHTIREKGSCPLFRSHKEGVADGEQARDFVFVGDIVKMIDFLLAKLPESGIYNAGSGKARTFYDMARATFKAMGAEEKIDWMDTPEQFRSTYQYFTEADMSKFRSAGLTDEFTSLEEGVNLYVGHLKGLMAQAFQEAKPETVAGGTEGAPEGSTIH